MPEPKNATVPGDYKFAFVLDQQVGLKTFALNLEAVARADAAITPTFVPVRYETPAGLVSRLPGVPGSIKGTLRGVGEIRNALGGTTEHWDALFWLSWATKSVPNLVKSAPSFLMMDMTPVQMEQMGDLYGYSKNRARFLGGWKKRASLDLYKNVYHLFTWSQWAKNSLISDYDVPDAKVTVVSPGVDTALYRPGTSEEKSNDHACRLLFVGGDFVRKGGDLLLRWARETQIAQRWELHIVTRDDVEPTPNVVVHHNVANNSDTLLGLYRTCDLFVLPTRADCYSLVGMEAQASGLPVILSDLAGIPDVVAPGETGLLVAPNDYNALAHALDTMVCDPAKRVAMGKAARVRAERLFDCRVNLGGILQTMKQAVDAKGGAR